MLTSKDSGGIIVSHRFCRPKRKVFVIPKSKTVRHIAAHGLISAESSQFFFNCFLSLGSLCLGSLLLRLLLAQSAFPLGGLRVRLGERGLEPVAIDISQLSVEVMKERGIDARNINFFDETFTEKFDTILFAMNGIGIVGKIDRLPDFFRSIKLSAEVIKSVS